jgi:hypothetical protein
MATETIPSSPAPTPKMSRYRSVRRAQAGQLQQDQPALAVPPMPPMPAVPETQPQNDAPISRSMSRYHRRPTTSHATSPNTPPLRSNTITNAPPPLPAQLPPSTSRSRALSSPYQSSHVANTGQRRPRTARTRAEASPPVSNAPRQQSLRGDDSAREVLQREKERQRQLKEKYEAEARAQRQAKQAELERIEKMRQEEEEAARLEAQREMEENMNIAGDCKRLRPRKPSNREKMVFARRSSKRKSDRQPSQSWSRRPEKLPLRLLQYRHLDSRR